MLQSFCCVAQKGLDILVHVPKIAFVAMHNMLSPAAVIAGCRIKQLIVTGKKVRRLIECCLNQRCAVNRSHLACNT